MTQIQRKIGKYYSRLPDSDHPIYQHPLPGCLPPGGRHDPFPAGTLDNLDAWLRQAAFNVFRGMKILPKATG
jgi:hypothetical protein